MIETCELLAPAGGCRWCGGPLPPGRRTWCREECQRGFAVNHYWSSARPAALQRDGFACQVCGATDGLEVHHDPKAPNYGRGCHHHQDRLVTLCAEHHRERDRVASDDRPVQLSLVA